MTSTDTTDDDGTFLLDPTCPVCREPHDVTDAFDGSERRCLSCGRTLVCVLYTDGSAYMQRYSHVVPDRSGRQRTRARWKRQGRRG